MLGAENESVVQKSIQSKQKSEPIDCGRVWWLLTHPSSRFPNKWKAFDSVLCPSKRTQGLICICSLGRRPRTSGRNIDVGGINNILKLSISFFISCNLYWLFFPKHVDDLQLLRRQTWRERTPTEKVSFLDWFDRFKSGGQIKSVHLSDSFKLS